MRTRRSSRIEGRPSIIEYAQFKIGHVGLIGTYMVGEVHPGFLVLVLPPVQAALETPLPLATRHSPEQRRLVQRGNQTSVLVVRARMSTRSCCTSSVIVEFKTIYR